MKAAEIILDYNLYPRNNIDSHNVRTLVDAMAAGAVIPPVVIDRKSKRAVDGFHRVLATLKKDGPDAEIEVVEKTYKNEAALFIDAARLNSCHGARLDPCDRTHCMIVAERLSIPLEAMAEALHMPADKLGALHNGRTAITAGGLTIPLKRTNQHMAGKRLNQSQIEANDRSSGMRQVFYVNQVIDLIEAKLLNQEDENLLDRLRHLHGLLESLLAAV